MAKISLSAQIRKYIERNPTKKVTEIAKELGMKYQYVYVVKKKMDKKQSELAYKIGQGHRVNPEGKILMQAAEPLKEPQPWKTVHISTSDNSIEAAIGRNIAAAIREAELPVTMEEPKADPVNHPAHYKYGGIETIDFIEAKELGYNLGNVVKYVTRSDHKGNRKQDLEKAAWYLAREINSIK
jgi:hypothetical protein